MDGCCTPGGYEQVFDAREARRDAAHYRQHGLEPAARAMVEYLRGRGVSGSTVLDVGGGIGAVHIELLRAGAARAVNVELSGAYEQVARELLAEAGVGDRVEREQMDFARDAARVEPADVVVMNKVVCCYPDMPTLVTAAAARARRFLAISFPRRVWWIRLAVGAANLAYRVRRSAFRAYVHPPAAVLSQARAQGLRPVHDHRGWIWQAVVLERAQPSGGG